jgi:hypothetical protein
MALHYVRRNTCRMALHYVRRNTSRMALHYVRRNTSRMALHYVPCPPHVAHHSVSDVLAAKWRVDALCRRSTLLCGGGAVAEPL